MKKVSKTKDNLRQFLTVKNETLTSADLYFYGDIVSNWWGAWDNADQYPEAIRNFLKDKDGKALNIYINSGGGSVFAGIAIYNMLRRHKGYKTVHVDGMAASIASVIALAGDKIIIPANAFIMIHKPWNFCEGNANDLRKMADDMDVIEEGIINVYKDHLAEGASLDDVRRMVDEETWLCGEEAAKYFDIEVGEAATYAAKITDRMKAYAKIPEQLINPNKIKDQINRIAISAIAKGV